MLVVKSLRLMNLIRRFPPIHEEDDVPQYIDISPVQKKNHENRSKKIQMFKLAVIFKF